MQGRVRLCFGLTPVGQGYLGLVDQHHHAAGMNNCLLLIFSLPLESRRGLRHLVRALVGPKNRNVFLEYHKGCNSSCVPHRGVPTLSCSCRCLGVSAVPENTAWVGPEVHLI